MKRRGKRVQEIENKRGKKNRRKRKQMGKEYKKRENKGERERKRERERERERMKTAKEKKQQHTCIQPPIVTPVATGRTACCCSAPTSLRFL